MSFQGFVKVATTAQLPPGETMLVEVEDKRILLANVDGAYHAVSEVCTHAEGPLSEGHLEGDGVTCPLHGSVFKLTTGEVVTPPADEPLEVYRVKVEEEDILVDVGS